MHLLCVVRHAFCAHWCVHTHAHTHTYFAVSCRMGFQILHLECKQEESAGYSLHVEGVLDKLVLLHAIYNPTEFICMTKLARVFMCGSKTSVILQRTSNHGEG